MNFSGKKVLIASDHAGLELKSHFIKSFPEIQWQNLGTNSTESVDYPDFASRLAEQMKNEDANTLAVLVCGSGQGMCIKANRFPHMRAALCWNEEVAKLAREHNDANTLCLGGRMIPFQIAEKILQTFLSTPFAGGRHQVRVDKLSDKLTDKHK